MDLEMLARVQFAVTIAFHYIYPPMSIGLGVILVIMEGSYLKTGNRLYEQMTKFWIKVFSLTFAIGVGSGIVMEFEFGTNWSTYARYVGDVFGSALAAEGIFAFFLESGFLAILVFGWNKVGPKTHFFATVMVSLGSMFSAVWILVANSWMQTPAGFHIVGQGLNQRAEITDFWAVVLNPSILDRLFHVLVASFLTGAFLVLSVSAYYLLKRRHTEFARASVRIALSIAIVASLLQLITGHRSAMGVAKNQPAKLAAMEAHYTESAPAPLYLFGWVNDEEQRVNLGIKVPGMLSLLLYGDTTHPVIGLNSFPEDERPPVNIVFQAYHIMVAVGMLLILISLTGCYLWFRGRLAENTLYLKILTASVVLPHFANQFGWITAEVGRQPWIVYGIMKTSEGLSKVVSAGQVWFSLILFTLIYLLLFVLFLFLLDRKIKHGPEDPDTIPTEYQRGRGTLDNFPDTARA